MPVRRERARDVNQMHHAAAEHIAQRIRIVWQHGFHDFRPRGAYRLAHRIGGGPVLGLDHLCFFVRFWHDFVIDPRTPSSSRRSSRSAQFPDRSERESNRPSNSARFALSRSNRYDTMFLTMAQSQKSRREMLGQFLARLGRLEEARRTLSDGIVVAQKAGDIHARDEMQSALNQLR